MKHVAKLLAVSTLVALSLPAQAEIAIDVIGPFEVSLEGLVQGDANWFHNDVVDLNGPANSAGSDGKNSEFAMRRAELVLKGKGDRFDWVVGYDARADKFLDTNVKWKLGSHALTVGQYKQPNSLEELSSTKHGDFISKAMTTNLFGIGRRTGIAFGGESGIWGYTVSAFGREMTRNLAHGSGFGGRVYLAPINESGHLLHFGLSAADYDTDADSVQLRVRPDADFATVRLIDTGALRNSDRQTTYGLEGLYVHGPFKFQGEYMTSTIDRYTPSRGNPAAGADFKGDSWYLQGIWNVTGESWQYKAGAPVTVLPNDPAAGMWQVGLRYDATDLNDHIVLGGEEQNLTVGVNYYWRSNFKFMLNYVDVSSERFSSTLRREVNDDPSIVEFRAQFYW